MKVMTESWKEAIRAGWQAIPLFIIFYVGLPLAFLLAATLWFVSFGHIGLWDSLINPVARAFDKLAG